ncbi:MAG: VacJ family lipoprotein [Desulfovibrionales bacterium]|nr:VacJ family lipoprotein [Desulfovibrionales bacterium]
MRILFLIVLFVSVVGCASAPEHRPGPFQAPVHRGLAEDSAVERPFLVEDPWEGFNRRMYHFNAQLDRYVYLPVVNVYEEILPDPVQQGVSNIFNNLKEISIFVNSVLQGKAKKASVSLGRFIFNTTIGVGGLFDVLGNGGIPQEQEDFGQTLGFWGAPAGPYLILPVFGPSNVRDTGGLAVDAVMNLNTADMFFDGMGWAARSTATTGVYSVKAVDARHQVKFRYYETGSPFEYQLVRFFSSKKRELDIHK